VTDAIRVENNSFGVAYNLGNGNLYAITLILFDQKKSIIYNTIEI
jgi:hypothetical protein